jgi:hypothetical protein
MTDLLDVAVLLIAIAAPFVIYSILRWWVTA